MDNLRGIVARDWWRLLRDNRFAIDREYLGRGWALTVMSIRNAIAKRAEERRFGAVTAAAQVQPPVFIIGHWRSGTTLLHELLAMDEQFTYPTLFQVSNPHTFLSWEEQVAAYYRSAREPAQTRPQDNMEITFDSPGEDEAALAMASLYSPVIAWAFPRREAFYDRYYTFGDVPPAELAVWKTTLVWFLKKLSIRYPKPAVLKSPTHTCRIRLLLELFPEAKFIHIHRNPYDVFRSTQQLYARAVPFSYLQQPPPNQVDEGIIRRYTLIYDAFFAEQPLIPARNYCEIGFEDLEHDMIGQIGRLYEQLHLVGFDALRSRLEQYIVARQGYQKNRHEALPESIRTRLARSWRRCFDTWGYAA